MNKIAVFLLIAGVAAIVTACGTDAITIQDNSNDEHGSVLYVSPADSEARETTTAEKKPAESKADKRFIITFN